MDKLGARIRCWWHCLLRFHRMASEEQKWADDPRWTRTRIFCGDCGAVFYHKSETIVFAPQER